MEKDIVISENVVEESANENVVDEIVASEEVVSDENNDTPPSEPFKLDEENPINDISEKQLGELLQKVRTMVEFMQSQWENSKREFNLTDTHMRALYDYNEKHRIPPSEGVDPEGDEYDRFNGLDNIDIDTVISIFGEDHSIIGINDEITVARIKSIVNDFFGWMGSLKEYNQIHDAYMELLELKEESQIDQLKKRAEDEEDPDKKAKLKEAVDNYYSLKYLDFLQDPLDELTITRLLKAFTDEQKIQYWIERSRDRLNQLKVSPKFILEISQMEKRFLPERYHKQNNIFLLYFMSTTIYCDIYSTTDNTKSKILCIVVALDRLIRNKWNDEVKARIVHNLIAFEDQFVDRLANIKSAIKDS